MKPVKIDENFSQILNVDPIAEVEKVIGKSYKEFDRDENLNMLGTAFAINQIKGDYLKSLGDTHFGIKFNELIDLIKAYGFKEALHYRFTYEPSYSNESRDEQAIIYYHPKGLILWATSYGDSLNGGNLYGQLKYPHPVEYKTIQPEWEWAKPFEQLVMTDDIQQAFQSLRGCSHGGDITTGRDFSYDIREALINKISSIEKHWELMNPWTKDRFLWFVDYKEEKVEGYDYEQITLDKIKRCPQEFQDMIRPCIEKLENSRRYL